MGGTDCLQTVSAFFKTFLGRGTEGQKMVSKVSVQMILIQLPLCFLFCELPLQLEITEYLL